MYIFPHNPIWENDYQCERRQLVFAYGEGINFFHIGSTAIAGLYAKDCIDILGVVTNRTDIPSKIETFLSLGYEYKGEYGITGREYFSKTTRKVHLHLYEVGDVHIAQHLKFIDVMRSSPALIEQLNQLKLSLHNLYPNNKERYQNEKQVFYDEILKMR